MKLKLGTVEFVTSKPAQWPYPTGFFLSQASEKSASGVTHVEDFNVRTGIFTYNFNDSSDLDQVGIQDFFLNTAVGKLNKFELTDDLGVARVVRFTGSSIEPTNTFNGLWSFSFSVEEVI